MKAAHDVSTAEQACPDCMQAISVREHQPQPKSAASSMFFAPMYGPDFDVVCKFHYAQSYMKLERKIRTLLVRALDLFESSPASNQAVGCWHRRAPITVVEKQANRLHAVRIKVEGMAHPPDRACFDSDAAFVKALRKWLREVPPMRLKVNYRDSSSEATRCKK